MLTRYKIPIFATAIDITCLALFWFVNPADDLANNSFNFKNEYLILFPDHSSHETEQKTVRMHGEAKVTK